MNSLISPSVENLLSKKNRLDTQKHPLETKKSLQTPLNLTLNHPETFVAVMIGGSDEPLIRRIRLHEFFLLILMWIL